MTNITRRAAIAALALAAPSLALAAEPRPVEREEIPVTEIFVSDLLNWEGTTDEEWASLHALMARYLKECPDAISQVVSRHDALAAADSASAKGGEPATVDTGALDEFGDFDFYVSTPGGTTEGGNVPQWAVHGGVAMAQCGITAKNGGGSVYLVLYDGVQVDEIQFDYRADTSLTLSGGQLAPGVHTVELVLVDDGEVIAHRSAKIEIVQ